MVEPRAGGVGTGPYGGLFATDLNSLLSQVALPIGAEPFHYIPVGGGRSFGPYSLPAGTVFDMIVFDLYALDFGALSTAARFTF